MGPEALALLAIGTSVTSAGAMGAMSYINAENQNSSAKKQAEATNKATEAQQKQLVEQAALEKQKRVSEAQQIRSKLRVASGESGVALASAERQAGFDLSLNLNVLNDNLENQLALVRSQGQADLAALEGRYQNTLLSTLTGGLQGAATGLAITNAVSGIGDAIQRASDASKLASDIQNLSSAAGTNGSYIGSIGNIG